MKASAQRFFGAGSSGDLRPGLRVATSNRRNVQRRGKVGDNPVQERKDTLILERGSAKRGLNPVFEGSFAQDGVDGLRRDIISRKIGFGNAVIQIAERFQHTLSGPSRLRLQVVRDGRAFCGLPVLPPEANRFHGDEINQPLMLRFGADRPLNGYRCSLQFAADVIEHAAKIRAHSVHLVDKDETRDAVALRLPPDCLRLGLNSADRAKDGDATVEDPEGAFDLHGKVHMSGRIDEMDVMATPRTGGDGGRDRDAPLLLLHHPVHGGFAVVHLSRLVDSAGVEQDTLGNGRLARVNVGSYADVANAGHSGRLRGSHGGGKVHSTLGGREARLWSALFVFLSGALTAPDRSAYAAHRICRP